MSSRPISTEIIAISSGKGGTGKTLIAACLGYSLTKAGHAVLMIDADPGTDGLSLFLLGPEGMDTVEMDVKPRNTFRYVLEGPNASRTGSFETFTIHRREDGHRLSYEALISSKTLYGNLEAGKGQTVDHVIPKLERTAFREALKGLFAGLREAGRFDYVLIDTRGGFAFESTDICALADSFIVVTEPDYTSFYQDRNLIQWVNRGAEAMDTQPLLRAIIVNKATNGEESSFRLELQREFPVKFNETHVIPLDVNAITAYRHQLIPYAVNPGSDFAAHTMQAFSRIMRVVTSQWDPTRVDAWNDLVDQVSKPFASRFSLVARLKAAARRSLWATTALAAVVIGWGVSAWLTDRAETLRAEQVENLYLADASAFQRTTDLKALLDAGENAFYGADLSGLDISQFDLSWARLQRANLEGAVLVGANLIGAELQGAVLVEANLRGAFLSFANLQGADLDSANLQGADLDSADLREAFLYQVNLQGATLKDTNLQGADLGRASLQGANLGRAKLQGADLDSADFQEANLSAANLTEAKNLTLEQVDEACGNDETRLPDYLSDYQMNPCPTPEPSPSKK